MSQPIILSVNGQNGLDYSKAVDKFAQIGREVARKTTIQGSNGVNATEPIQGQPAGSLAVELLESNTTNTEGFMIRVREQVPRNRVASLTPIHPQRNIVLQAIGGDGEPGRTGGRGEDGMDGLAGIDATRFNDAGSGTNGENGGDGGRGSNGADGGNGGTIAIHVDEDKTHLLLAVDWDVHGGKGGAAGIHGEPGQGGRGGKAGQGFAWPEQNGFRYKCTENCLGGSIYAGNDVESTALVRYNPTGSPSRIGSVLQNTSGRITQVNAIRRPDTNGLCVCSGGNGYCVGCEKIPQFTTRVRQPGTDGLDGQPGTKSRAPLLAGTDGNFGTGTIVVRSSTGEEHVYHNRYRLELVDFDVEDENEDGVFEPGEHLFIRRIRVRNLGGMPSPGPNRMPLLQVMPSEYLAQVMTKEGRTFIPSIPPGQIVTLPGSIKVMIKQPELQNPDRSPYKKVITLKLKATMLGLHRQLEDFSYQADITTEFPLEIGKIQMLQTLAQGSLSRIIIQIHNRGAKLFEESKLSSRGAEIRLSIHSSIGLLRSPDGSWEENIILPVNAIKAKGTLDLLQSLRVLPDAVDHLNAKIRVEFYLSGHEKTHQLIQSFDLSFQISASYEFDKESSILLVTNSETNPNRFQAVKSFIREELGLKMDIWNVSLYGGMENHSKEAPEPSNILEAYRTKTILFLGNKFNYFDLGRRTVLDSCNLQTVAFECFAGSKFVFLGIPNAAQQNKWLENAMFPVRHTVSDTFISATHSATFRNKSDLVKAICQERTNGTPALQSYKVEVTTKSFLGRKLAIKWQSRKIRLYLNCFLPQENFLICPVYPKTDGTSGGIIVWHGLPHSTTLHITDPKPLKEDADLQATLHPFDSYSIICALPLVHRVSLMWPPVPTAENILDAMQFSIEEEIHAEIRSFLNKAPLLNRINLSRIEPYSEFALHFPCLEVVLQHVAHGSKPTTRVLSILRFAIASTFPPNKRSAVRDLLGSFSNRRSHLNKYLSSQILAILESKGFTEDELNDFKSSIKALRFRHHFSTKLNIAELIEDRNSKFTNCSTHRYRHGRLRSQKVVQETKLCTEEEWNERYEMLKNEGERIEHETREVHRKKANMNILQG